MPEVNLLAVLVSAVAAFIIGMLWYSPALFGNAWMSAMGKTKEQLEIEKKEKGMAKPMILGFIAALVTAYVLSHILYFREAEVLLDGVSTGFWIWLGFVATSTISAYLWEGRPWKLFWIYNAMQLVNLIVMGIILVSWM